MQGLGSSVMVPLMINLAHQWTAEEEATLVLALVSSQAQVGMGKKGEKIEKQRERAESSHADWSNDHFPHCWITGKHLRMANHMQPQCGIHR